MEVEDCGTYLIVRYPEENWAEIDAPGMAFKYWEGPLDILEDVIETVIRKCNLT